MSAALLQVHETRAGFLIKDPVGDTIAALAGETGDHTPVEQAAYALLFAASPPLLASLKECLAEIDFELEQRKTGGNGEHWRELQAISDNGHRAVRAAEGRS